MIQYVLQYNTKYILRDLDQVAYMPACKPITDNNNHCRGLRQHSVAQPIDVRNPD